MTANRRPTDGHGSAAPDAAPEPGRRELRTAWWSFALLPVSFVAAAVLGGWMLAATGHDPDSEADPTWWRMLVAGVPSVLVLLVPCALVIVFARRAVRAGNPGGREATKAGLVVGAALVAMNLVSVLVRLVDALV